MAKKNTSAKAAIAHRTCKRCLSDVLMRIEPLNSIIPSGPVNAALARAQQQEIWQDQTITYCEAADRIRKASREAGPEDGESRALALCGNVVAIAARFDKDAFEECRREKGLDMLRDELLDQLRTEISFERGFEMFREALAKKRIRVNSWEDLNSRYPDLTAAEVALCSLLTRVPHSYLATGPNGLGGIEYGAMIYPPLYSEFGDTLCQHLVASIYRATPPGINFILDYVGQEELVREKGSPKGGLDPYSDGGITGAHLDLELVPFRPRIREAFRQLVVLAISNRKIHDRLFRESDECFTAAFGVILRKSFNEVTGALSLPASNIQAQVDSLDRGMRAAVLRRAGELESNLCKAQIYDLTLGRILSPEDVFRLVALIQKPPGELFQEGGFSGYSAAYGFGVRFAGADGSFIGHSPYRAHYVRTAASNIHYETEEFENDTSVISELFETLHMEEIAKTCGGMIEGGRQYSRLEELRLDLFVSTGIELAFYPRQYLETYCKEGCSTPGPAKWTGARESAKPVQSFTTRKIGFEEASLISETLKVLPREMLSGVKRISKKESSLLSIASIASGMLKLGEYSPSTMEITMFENPDAPFNTGGGLMRYLYAFTLVHEVGESVWANMDEAQRAEYSRISGWGEGPGGRHGVSDDLLNSHFLSAYSFQTGPNDDFAEHFAFYVLHAGEFRQRTEESGALGEKYAFLERAFTVSGKPVRYPQLCNATIKEVHGDLEKEVKRYDFAAAVALQDKRIDDRIMETEDIRARIKISLEEYEEELYGKQDAD